MSETIPFLARCLEKIFVRAPTADELRAAANDDQSYNDKLWALLHRFVILDMAIKKVNECPSIDKLHELSQITPQTLSDDEMHYVKWYMDGIHFKLPMFYSEETTNSRILILSIGWMLEYTRFFDIYYIIRDRESATKLPLAFTPPYPPDTSFDESNIMASSSRTESQQTSAFVSVFDSNKSKLENHEQISNKLRQIVYLNGKIDISLRAMDQLQEEYHAKMNKILQHSTDRDPVHNPKLRHSLGFERVAAIKSSLRERALKALDMHTTLVQDRTKEHQLENNVWRWLNHVFECADKAGQCGVPPNKPQKSRVHFEDRHIARNCITGFEDGTLTRMCHKLFFKRAKYQRCLERNKIKLDREPVFRVFDENERRSKRGGYNHPTGRPNWHLSDKRRFNGPRNPDF